MTTVPLAGWLTAVTIEPLRNSSLASTLITTDSPCSVLALSSTASTGGMTSSSSIDVVSGTLPIRPLNSLVSSTIRARRIKLLPSPPEPPLSPAAVASSTSPRSSPLSNAASTCSMVSSSTALSSGPAAVSAIRSRVRVISGISLMTRGEPSVSDNSTRPPSGVTTVSPSLRTSPVRNSRSSPSALRAYALPVTDATVAIAAFSIVVFLVAPQQALKLPKNGLSRLILRTVKEAHIVLLDR